MPRGLAEEEEPEERQGGQRGQKDEGVPRRQAAPAHAAPQPQAPHRPLTEAASGSSHERMNRGECLEVYAGMPSTSTAFRAGR